METLGCAGVICSDKTGTLTQNRMTVVEVWTPRGEDRDMVLTVGALCSDARLTWRGREPVCTGDPTEGAVVEAAARAGLDKNRLEEEQPRRAELPFDSERKLMTTVHRRPDGRFRVCVKGAPDVLLARCGRRGIPHARPPPATGIWPAGRCGCWGWPIRTSPFSPGVSTARLWSRGSPSWGWWG